MKVMITGGLGGLGLNISRAFLDSGHEILVFDLDNPVNRARRTELPPGADVVWGDIGDAEALRREAVRTDLILHLAAIIPPLSEQKPDLTQRVNVEGTRNVVQAAVSARKPLVFTSSVSVFGPTPGAKAPLHPDRNPMNGVDHYTRSKVEGERIVTGAGIDYVICRIAAAPHLDLSPARMREMFMFPHDSRIEFVHLKDVATALVHAAERFGRVKNRVYILGGGRSQQFLYHDFIARLMGVMGLPCPPARKFSRTPSYLDWYDTGDSQAALEFQNHTIDDFARDMAALIPAWQRFLMQKLVGPLFGRLIVQFL